MVVRILKVHWPTCVEGEEDNVYDGGYWWVDQNAYLPAYISSGKGR